MQVLVAPVQGFNTWVAFRFPLSVSRVTCHISLLTRHSPFLAFPYLTATISISTFAPLGSAETWTVDLAGYGCLRYLA